MKKRIIAALIFFLLLSPVITAQGTIPGVDQDQIQGDADKINEATGRLREFTEEDRVDFLGEKWKELLLTNEFIASVDSFFQSLNPLFIVLFARDYSLSLTMFFVIIFWVFTLISFQGHIWQGFEYILKSKIVAFLISLAATIIIAQIQIFNWFAEQALKITLYREGVWAFISWTVIFLLLFIYFYLNLMIIQRRKKDKEKGRLNKLEKSMHNEEEFRKGIREMAS